jgi:hypothetical protein
MCNLIRKTRPIVDFPEIAVRIAIDPRASWPDARHVVDDDDAAATLQSA